MAFVGKLQIEYIDGYKWRLIPNSRFYFIYNGKVIEPHYGFKSDLATIPRIFWSLLPPSGKYAPAAVIHDFMYHERHSKDYADKAFREAMRALGVNPIKREIMYYAVKWFGKPKNLN